MKGVALPTNALIIIILAVIVLVAVVAMLMGVWNPSGAAINLEATKNAACQKMTAQNCAAAINTIQITDFDADQDGSLDPGTTNTNTVCGSGGNAQDNLAMLCVCHYGITADADCKALCGC